MFIVGCLLSIAYFLFGFMMTTRVSKRKASNMISQFFTKKQRCTHATWENTPFHALDRVSFYLCPHTRVLCAAVCKNWRKAFGAGSVFLKRPCFDDMECIKSYGLDLLPIYTVMGILDDAVTAKNKEIISHVMIKGILKHRSDDLHCSRAAEDHDLLRYMIYIGYECGPITVCRAASLGNDKSLECALGALRVFDCNDYEDAMIEAVIGGSPRCLKMVLDYRFKCTVLQRRQMLKNAALKALENKETEMLSLIMQELGKTSGYNILEDLKNYLFFIDDLYCENVATAGNAVLLDAILRLYEEEGKFLCEKALARASTNLDCLKVLIDYGYENLLDKEVASAMIRENSVDCLVFALQKNIPKESLCESSAYHGNFECLRIAHGMGCPYHPTGLMRACLCLDCKSAWDKFDCLRYAVEVMGCKVWDRAFFVGLGTCTEEAVDYLWENVKLDKNNEYHKNLAQEEVRKIARNTNSVLEMENLLVLMTKQGDFREMILSVKESLMHDLSMAVETWGGVRLLQMAHKIGLPFSSQALICACRGGPATLSYVIATGCSMCSAKVAIYEASKMDTIECIRMLHEMGCVISEDCWRAQSTIPINKDMICYISHHCPRTILKELRRFTFQDIVDWVRRLPPRRHFCAVCDR